MIPNDAFMIRLLLKAIKLNGLQRDHKGIKSTQIPAGREFESRFPLQFLATSIDKNLTDASISIAEIWASPYMAC